MDLLWLWRDCRLVKALPKPGGWLDQPRLVRKAFPLFEQLMVDVEENAREIGQQKATAAALAAMVKLMRGG